jgi:hypothetical protein
MANYHCRLIILVLVFLALLVPSLAQTVADKKLKNSPGEKEASKSEEADALEAQRRTFAISLVLSLADDARSYRNLALRPHVLARAADTLWNADTDTARKFFRWAWEAAEKGDAEELTLQAQGGVSPRAAAIATALRRSSGSDLRAGVLALAARRDRALCEEFMNKLKQETNSEASDSKSEAGSRSSSDSWSSSEAVSKRLQLAARLLDQGEIELGLEFATPVLDKVNANTINFLSTLRGKKTDAADKIFASLMARAEFDPASDANTASGLSSYIFTPGLYITFSADGSARWSQPPGPISPLKPPNVPDSLRNRFFQVAAAILLRPLPPPDQDFTTSGRTGKYMIVKRLLPLFDQNAPDVASALRAQLPTLAGTGAASSSGYESPLLRQGLKSKETADNTFENMQDRLDHAKTIPERDSIYADAAAALANQGDPRAQELADKIDDSVRRARVSQYVDFELVQSAIRKKAAPEVVRLAQRGQLTHAQRVWAYTQAARLLMNSERLLALQMLEDAANEARRINVDDPDRARSFIAVATHFAPIDRVRAWEILGEAVKAANSSDKFIGDTTSLTFSLLSTRSGLNITSVSAEDFSLSGVLRSLTKDDLYRAIDLARSFKNDAPRAAAILSVAGAVLNGNVSDTNP